MRPWTGEVSTLVKRVKTRGLYGFCALIRMSENAAPVFWVNNSINRHFTCWLCRSDPVKPGFVNLRSPVLNTQGLWAPLNHSGSAQASAESVSWYSPPAFPADLITWYHECFSGSKVLALTLPMASNWSFFPLPSHPPLPVTFSVGGSEVPTLLASPHGSFVYVAPRGVSWGRRGRLVLS